MAALTNPMIDYNNPYIMPMPMPCLYNGIETTKNKPRLGIIELVICNIGAMLASIAMDFDVRLSNVAHSHPRSHQRQLAQHHHQQHQDDNNTIIPSRWWAAPVVQQQQQQPDVVVGSSVGRTSSGCYLGHDYEFSSSSGYAHNTYHGPARHYRPFLSNMSGVPGGLMIEKPLRFTDSPQHYPSATITTAVGVGGGSNLPTPSPRRKNSTSNDDAYLSSTAYVTDYGSPIYTSLQQQQQHHQQSRDYFRPIETGYLPPNEYLHDRLLECADYPHAYDNPSGSGNNPVNGPARVTSSARLTSYTHHRTPSNASNSSHHSNVNPSFKLDDEPDYPSSSLYSPGHSSLGYYRSSHYSTGYGSSSLTNHDYGALQYLTRQNSHHHYQQQQQQHHHHRHDSNSPNSIERPANLDIASRLRSSLKRSNYGYGSPNKSASRNNSGSGTPTNPTPPDSLTSEDSSYVSAKDGQISLSRVRFSPVTFDRELIQTPVQDIIGVQTPPPTTTTTTTMIISRNRLGSQTSASGRIRKPSVTELERDFLS